MAKTKYGGRRRSPASVGATACVLLGLALLITSSYVIAPRYSRASATGDATTSAKRIALAEREAPLHLPPLPPPPSIWDVADTMGEEEEARMERAVERRALAIRFEGGSSGALAAAAHALRDHLRERRQGGAPRQRGAVAVSRENVGRTAAIRPHLANTNQRHERSAQKRASSSSRLRAPLDNAAVEDELRGLVREALNKPLPELGIATAAASRQSPRRQSHAAADATAAQRMAFTSEKIRLKEHAALARMRAWRHARAHARQHGLDRSGAEAETARDAERALAAVDGARTVGDAQALRREIDIVAGVVALQRRREGKVDRARGAGAGTGTDAASSSARRGSHWVGDDSARLRRPRSHAAPIAQSAPERAVTESELREEIALHAEAEAAHHAERRDSAVATALTFAQRRGDDVRLLRPAEREGRKRAARLRKEAAVRRERDAARVAAIRASEQRKEAREAAI